MPESKLDQLEQAVITLAEATYAVAGPAAKGFYVDFGNNGEHAWRIPVSDDVYPEVGVARAPAKARSQGKN